MPVSAISPAILISEIEVEKKQQGQDLLPLLPNPLTEGGQECSALCIYLLRAAPLGGTPVIAELDTFRELFPRGTAPAVSREITPSAGGKIRQNRAHLRPQW